MPLPLNYASISFPGYGVVEGSSHTNLVTITTPSKYSYSNYLNKVVTLWIITSKKIIPGNSVSVYARELPYYATANDRYAKYTLNVKYNLNNATSPSSISNSSFTYEADDTTSNTGFYVKRNIKDTVPAKTDTTFAGWALENNTTQNLINAGGQVQKWFTPNGADQSATQNLYAVWKIYQRFNAKGGSFPTGSTTWDIKYGYYQTTGYTFTIPAGGPTKTGYEFLGWSQSSTATTPYIAKSSSTQTILLTKNTTWYAVWREQYKIEYKKGDGAGTEVTEYKSENVPYTLRDQTFTKTGYNQTGWSTTSGGPKAYNLKATYTTNASLTLYPYWTPKKYKVSYENKNTIKGFEEKIRDFPTDTTVSCGQSYQIPTKIPSCPYFWFNTNNIWKDQDSISYKPGDSFIMPAHNVTLTAQWVRKKANIKYAYDSTHSITALSNQEQGNSIDLWTKQTAEEYILDGTHPFQKSGYVLVYWKYKNQGYDLGSSFIVDDIINGGDIILEGVWIPIAQYRYPDYGASVYGARVIYDPDYIIEGGN